MQDIGHYLEYFLHYPSNKSTLQRQILSLTSKEDEAALVISTLNNFIREHSEDNFVKEILAGLYIKYKHFNKAYEIYKSLEKRSKTGKYLYNFAVEAYKNKEFILCIKTYHDLIQRINSLY